MSFKTSATGRKWRWPIRFQAIAILLGMLLLPSTAWAHKVNVFAYAEGNTVFTESYFNDGQGCRDSVIEVFDPQGNKLLEGTTDDEGRFSFLAPVKADLLIRLTASMGHRAEYTLPESELPDNLPPGAAGKVVAPEKSVVDMPESHPAEPESVEQQADASSAVPVATDIEQAVERAVAKQIVPLRRALEEQQRRQRFSDVIGGIGYIIGMMGLVLYFRSKQRQKER